MCDLAFCQPAPSNNMAVALAVRCLFAFAFAVVHGAEEIEVVDALEVDDVCGAETGECSSKLLQLRGNTDSEDFVDDEETGGKICNKKDQAQAATAGGVESFITNAMKCHSSCTSTAEGSHANKRCLIDCVTQTGLRKKCAKCLVEASLCLHAQCPNCSSEPSEINNACIQCAVAATPTCGGAASCGLATESTPAAPPAS